LLNVLYAIETEAETERLQMAFIIFRFFPTFADKNVHMMNSLTGGALCLVVLLGIAACAAPAEEEQVENVDYKTLSALTDKGIHVVVEIPAGTNRKIEYRPAEGAFEADRVEEEERIVRFLPYPGNYGFIPSTLMDAERGGDGDALDVLVIGESLPTGTVLEAVPVGALRLRDGGAIDTKIIAVPAEQDERVVDVTNFRDLLLEQDAARRIIEEWFLNYKGLGVVELIGWEDEHYAMEAIKRWSD